MRVLIAQRVIIALKMHSYIQILLKIIYVALGIIVQKEWMLRYNVRVELTKTRGKMILVWLALKDITASFPQPLLPLFAHRVSIALQDQAKEKIAQLALFLN